MGTAQGPVAGASYRLRFHFADGADWERDDPYRFLPTLGEPRPPPPQRRHPRTPVGGARRPPARDQGVAGVAFAVWAPNARSVRVVGDFDRWDGRLLPMRSLGASGVWELFVPGIGPASSTSTRCWARTGSCASRPTRSPSPSRYGRRPHRACGTSASTKAGPMTPGWPTAPAATRIGHQCRSTRSISALAAQRGRQPAGISPGRRAAGGALPSGRLHASSCCRWPSIRSTAHGATR